jgi:hypothetical protein
MTLPQAQAQRRALLDQRLALQANAQRIAGQTVALQLLTGRGVFAPASKRRARPRSPAPRKRPRSAAKSAGPCPASARSRAAVLQSGMRAIPSRANCTEAAMKTRVTWAVVLAAMAIGSSAGANAQMMMPGPGGGTMGFFSNPLTRDATLYGPMANMNAVASYWLSRMHTQLQITADQESAWQAFAAAVTAQADTMQAFRSQMYQTGTATAPERAQLAEQFLAQRLSAASAVSSSLSTLYARLGDSQRAIFDSGFALQCGPSGLFGD